MGLLSILIGVRTLPSIGLSLSTSFFFCLTNLCSSVFFPKLPHLQKKSPCLHGGILVFRCVHLCVCVCPCACVYGCVRLCVKEHEYVHGCLCGCACMHMCRVVCVCACVCVHIQCMHINSIHSYIHAHALINMHIYTHKGYAWRINSV